MRFVCRERGTSTDAGSRLVSLRHAPLGCFGRPPPPEVERKCGMQRALSIGPGVLIQNLLEMLIDFRGTASLRFDSSLSFSLWKIVGDCKPAILESRNMRFAILFSVQCRGCLECETPRDLQRSHGTTIKIVQRKRFLLPAAKQLWPVYEFKTINLSSLVNLVGVYPTSCWGHRSWRSRAAQ